VHYLGVTASFDLAGIDKPFELKLEYQGCADAGLCYPPQKKTLAIDPAKALVIDQAGATAPAGTLGKSAENNSAAPSASAPLDSGWLWQAISFALIGGIILNLMPCVFPVLSIKVMSLAAADRSRLVIHGWAYSFGITLCFVGFATALL